MRIFSPNCFQLQTLVEIDSVRNILGVLPYLLLHFRFQLFKLEGAARIQWQEKRKTSMVMHTSHDHSCMFLLPLLRKE